MRYHGVVGYITTEEVSPGVYEEVIKEVNCYGDVTRNHAKWQNGTGINDNLDISNNFSLVLHSMLLDNFMHLKYISWKGVRWEIQTIELAPPRLNILVGGVYHELSEPEPGGDEVGGVEDGTPGETEDDSGVE